MSKLSINIKEGILEVESDNDKLIEMVYADFKAAIAGYLPYKVQDNTNPKPTGVKNLSQPSTSNRAKKNSKKTTDTYKLDAELNLWKSDTKQGLKEFYSDKAPSTGYECNAIFIYYLQKIAKVEKINVNHVYTCYKEVGRAYPNALRQNLIDTKRDKGWIDTSDINVITLTSKGENFVEHNLPLEKNTKADE